jgi:hypothetical protein
LSQTNTYPNDAARSKACAVENAAANSLRASSTYFIVLNTKGLGLQMWRVDCLDVEAKIITAHFGLGARSFTTQTIIAKYVC